MKLILFATFAAISAVGQEPTSMRVDASRPIGSFKPIHGYFGYDEPNYTYTTTGRKLVSELVALSNTPVIFALIFYWQPEMALLG